MMLDSNMRGLIDGAPAASVRNNGIIGRDKLLTLKETADRLHMTTDQVIGFVDDGKLYYINVGRGKLKRRFRFAQSDIEQFQAERRIREAPCQFSKLKTVRDTGMTLGFKAIGLGELRKQKTAAKLKR
jgi:hypothetical protein